MASRSDARVGLAESEKTYYHRVESLLDGEAEEEGEGELFLRNVVDQVLSDGIRKVSCDKDGSRVLEKLICSPTLDLTSVEKITEAVVPDFQSLCIHRCGSHVAESLLKVVGDVISSGETGKIQQVFLTLCATLREKLGELLVNPYASHVLSAVIQVLGGVWVGEEASRSRSSLEFRKAKMAGVRVGVVRETERGRRRRRGGGVMVGVPEAFSKQLILIGKDIRKRENLSEVLCHECASPVVQVLVRVLMKRVPKYGAKFVRQVLRLPGVVAADGERELPSVFTDVVGSHSIATVIEESPPECSQVIYESCICGRAMDFALHPVANYPLQKFLLKANETQLSDLLPELGRLEDILCVGHTGVIVHLLQAVAMSCLEQQPALLQTLLKAFHCEASPKSCVPLFLHLITHEVFFGSDREEEKEARQTLTLHGSLIVQALLKFLDPKLVVSSLLHMSTSDLIGLACDANGNHVLEAFLASRSVAVKKKNSLVDKLTPHLLLLCRDKHGSRVVDTLWHHCEIAKKEALANELLAIEEELAENFYGKFVLRNCNIAHYKKKQASWQSGQRVMEKKRELFQDIISDRSSGGPDPGVEGREGGEGGGESRRREGTEGSRTGKGGERLKAEKKRKIPLFESDSEEEGSVTHAKKKKKK